RNRYDSRGGPWHPASRRGLDFHHAVDTHSCSHLCILPLDWPHRALMHCSQATPQFPASHLFFAVFFPTFNGARSSAVSYAETSHINPPIMISETMLGEPSDPREV